MKKLLFLCTIMFLLIGCDSKNTEQKTPTFSLKLGFCPTVAKDALSLQEKNQNLELVRFGSAGEILQNLKTENIDLALVGRKAKSVEINKNILEKNLETTERYTLINQQKQMIAKSDLPNLQVKTCLNESVKNQFPELNLTFEQTCNYTNGEVWLISWVDFSDEMELLIPVNENGEKVRKFRKAFLYGEDLERLNLENF